MTAQNYRAQELKRIKIELEEIHTLLPAP